MSEIVLALDTSSSHTYLAIAERGNDSICRSLYQDVVKKEQQDSLLDLVTIALNGAQLKSNQIDLLVYGRGPGSYTGLRAGLAFLKGLACAISRPIIGVSSYHAAARSFGKSGSFAVLSELRREQGIVGLYSVSAEVVGIRGGIKSESVVQLENLNSSELEPPKHMSLQEYKGLEADGYTLVSLVESLSWLAPTKALAFELIALSSRCIDSRLEELRFDLTSLSELEPDYPESISVKLSDRGREFRE